MANLPPVDKAAHHYHIKDEEAYGATEVKTSSFIDIQKDEHHTQKGEHNRFNGERNSVKAHGSTNVAEVPDSKAEVHQGKAGPNRSSILPPKANKPRTDGGLEGSNEEGKDQHQDAQTSTECPRCHHQVDAGSICGNCLFNTKFAGQIAWGPVGKSDWWTKWDPYTECWNCNHRGVGYDPEQQTWYCPHCMAVAVPAETPTMFESKVADAHDDYLWRDINMRAETPQLWQGACPNCNSENTRPAVEWINPVDDAPAQGCRDCNHVWNSMGTLQPGYNRDDLLHHSANDPELVCPHCGSKGTSIQTSGWQGQPEESALCMYCLKTFDPETPTLFDKQATPLADFAWEEDPMCPYGHEITGADLSGDRGWCSFCGKYYTQAEITSAPTLFDKQSTMDQPDPRGQAAKLGIRCPSCDAVGQVVPPSSDDGQAICLKCLSWFPWGAQQRLESEAPSLFDKQGAEPAPRHLAPADEIWYACPKGHAVAPLRDSPLVKPWCPECRKFYERDEVTPTIWPFGEWPPEGTLGHTAGKWYETLTCPKGHAFQSAVYRDEPDAVHWCPECARYYGQDEVTEPLFNPDELEPKQGALPFIEPEEDRNLSAWSCPNGHPLAVAQWRLDDQDPTGIWDFVYCPQCSANYKLDQLTPTMDVAPGMHPKQADDSGGRPGLPGWKEDGTRSSYYCPEGHPMNSANLFWRHGTDRVWLCVPCNKSYPDSVVSDDAAPTLFHHSLDQPSAIDLFGVPTCPSCGSKNVFRHQMRTGPVYQCLDCNKAFNDPEDPHGHNFVGRAPEGETLNLFDPRCPDCGQPATETDVNRNFQSYPDRRAHYCGNCQKAWWEGDKKLSAIDRHGYWLHPKASCPECGSSAVWTNGDNWICHFCGKDWDEPNAPSLFDDINDPHQAALPHDQSIDLFGIPSCPYCGSHMEDRLLNVGLGATKPGWLCTNNQCDHWRPKDEDPEWTEIREKRSSMAPLECPMCKLGLVPTTNPVLIADGGVMQCPKCKAAFHTSAPTLFDDKIAAGDPIGPCGHKVVSEGYWGWRCLTCGRTYPSTAVSKTPALWDLNSKDPGLGWDPHESAIPEGQAIDLFGRPACSSCGRDDGLEDNGDGWFYCHHCGQPVDGTFMPYERQEGGSDVPETQTHDGRTVEGETAGQTQSGRELDHQGASSNGDRWAEYDPGDGQSDRTAAIDPQLVRAWEGADMHTMTNASQLDSPIKPPTLPASPRAYSKHTNTVTVGTDCTEVRLGSDVVNQMWGYTCPRMHTIPVSDVNLIRSYNRDREYGPQADPLIRCYQCDQEGVSPATYRFSELTQTPQLYLDLAEREMSKPDEERDLSTVNPDSKRTGTVSSTVWNAEDLLRGPIKVAIGEPSGNGTWPADRPGSYNGTCPEERPSVLWNEGPALDRTAAEPLDQAVDLFGTVTCPQCGSNNTKDISEKLETGPYRNRVKGPLRPFQCQDCSAWWREKDGVLAVNHTGASEPWIAPDGTYGWHAANPGDHESIMQHGLFSNPPGLMPDQPEGVYMYDSEDPDGEEIGYDWRKYLNLYRVDVSGLPLQSDDYANNAFLHPGDIGPERVELASRADPEEETPLPWDRSAKLHSNEASLRSDLHPDMWVPGPADGSLGTRSREEALPEMWRPSEVNSLSQRPRISLGSHSDGTVWRASSEDSPYMYHVAPEDRRKHIEQNGLVAGEPVWDNADDWDPGIYLWDNEDNAMAYGLETFQRGRDQGYDLYRVNNQGLADLAPDTSGDQPVPGAWFHPGPIPPEHIERHHVTGNQYLPLRHTAGDVTPGSYVCPEGHLMEPDQQRQEFDDKYPNPMAQCDQCGGKYYYHPDYDLVSPTPGIDERWTRDAPSLFDVGRTSAGANEPSLMCPECSHLFNESEALKPDFETFPMGLDQFHVICPGCRQVVDWGFARELADGASPQLFNLYDMKPNEHTGGQWYEDPDQADWQHGLCDTYALAMKEMHPHLRLGVAEGGRHYFTHDDQYAYDSLGRHPLPYQGINEDDPFEYTELDQEPAYWFGNGKSVYDQNIYGENAGSEEYERAKQLIPQQHPWLAERTSRQDSALDLFGGMTCPFCGSDNSYDQGPGWPDWGKYYFGCDDCGRSFSRPATPEEAQKGETGKTKVNYDDDKVWKIGSRSQAEWERLKQQTNEAYGPSQSEVIHQWPDGWNVQRHDHPEDVKRIGEMMANCWKKGPMRPYEDVNGQFIPETHYYSLHDPEGRPKIAVDHPQREDGNPSSDLGIPLGAFNVEPWNSTKGRSYLNRLSDWATQSGYKNYTGTYMTGGVWQRPIQVPFQAKTSVVDQSLDMFGKPSCPFCGSGDTTTRQTDSRPWWLCNSCRASWRKNIDDEGGELQPGIVPGGVVGSSYGTCSICGRKYWGDSCPNCDRRTASWHDLQWDQGEEGKGWLLSDGTVRNWNVDSYGDPHHADKVDDYDSEWDNGGIPFNIAPDGTAWSEHFSDDLHPGIFEADPRLKPQKSHLGAQRPNRGDPLHLRDTQELFHDICPYCGHTEADEINIGSLLCRNCHQVYRDTQWYSPKQSMAADPEWWANFQKTNPYVYHSGPEESLEGISQHGIVPWDDPRHPGSEVEGTLGEPRPGHIYFNVDRVPGYGSAQYRVPSSVIDPALMNPDEDDFEAAGTPGGWLAEEHGLGNDPADTHKGIENRSGNFAYRGTIPPHQIEYRMAEDPMDPFMRNMLGPAYVGDEEEGWQPLRRQGATGPPEGETLSLLGKVCPSCGAPNVGRASQNANPDWEWWKCPGCDYSWPELRPGRSEQEAWEGYRDEAGMSENVSWEEVRDQEMETNPDGPYPPENPHWTANLQEGSRSLGVKELLEPDEFGVSSSHLSINVPFDSTTDAVASHDTDQNHNGAGKWNADKDALDGDGQGKADKQYDQADTQRQPDGAPGIVNVFRGFDLTHTGKYSMDEWTEHQYGEGEKPTPDWSLVPPCPKCGGQMDFRDSASLGPLYPEGAWQCYDCFNVFPLGEITPNAPEAPPQPEDHPDPWMDNEPGATTFPGSWAARKAALERELERRVAQRMEGQGQSPSPVRETLWEPQEAPYGHSQESPRPSWRPPALPWQQRTASASKTAAGGIFYHVAPAEHRETIQQEGLKPTDETPSSPWADERATWKQQIDQPPGVYMWDSPENARSYAYALQGRNRATPWPGDSDDDFEEKYNWDRNPDDDAAELIPRTDTGYDVWKVNAQGLPIAIDPEKALTEGQLTAEEAQAQMNKEHQEYGGSPEMSEGHRWYVPGHIPPERIEHHQNIPLHDMTESDFYDTLDEGRQVPEAWSQVPFEEWNDKARKRYMGSMKIRHTSSKEGFQVFTAYAGRIPVGYIQARVKGDDAEVFYIWVGEPYRNRGIGKELIAAVQEANPGKKLSSTIETPEGQRLLDSLPGTFAQEGKAVRKVAKTDLRHQVGRALAKLRLNRSKF